MYCVTQHGMQFLADPHIEGPDGAHHLYFIRDNIATYSAMDAANCNDRWAVSYVEVSCRDALDCSRNLCRYIDGVYTKPWRRAVSLPANNVDPQIIS